MTGRSGRRGLVTGWLARIGLRRRPATTRHVQRSPTRRPIPALEAQGGLEKVFFELAQLPPNAIRDPATCAAISARYDSIPV